jgi:hypothetical protein
MSGSSSNLFDNIYGAGSLTNVAFSGQSLNAVPKTTSAGAGGSGMNPMLLGAGIGAIGDVVGGIFQGRAMATAARIQANASNNAALAGFMGQAMAMGQNRLDRGYRSIADMYNMKAASDARADNYRYGMNAFLMKNEGDIQQSIIGNAGLMRRETAGKSMDALNSIIDTSNNLRMADNAFANASLLNTQGQQLAERAGKFRAFFENPMETAERGYRERQDIGIALSKPARELSQRERKGRIQEAVAIQRGVLDKMFGNTTPSFYG